MKTISRVLLLPLALVVVGQLSFAFAQAPRFLSPTSYSVPGASMAVVADVNGDGFPDIVTANGFTGGQGVSLLLNKGNGTFRAARSIVATGNPTYLAVADFNGDGKADVAIANGPGTSTVTLLLGNGDGTFQLPIELFVGEADTLAVADFNGDGKADLAAAGPVAGETILINTGAGIFRTSYTLPANPSIFPAIIAGDFNHDGKQDFFISGGSYDLQLGNGDGTFHDSGLQALPSILYSFVGDFNGDGRLDIATVSPTTHELVPEIALGQPDGSFASSFITNFTAGGTNSIVADFDLDGKQDIFSALGLSLGHGDGMFQLVGAGFGSRPGFPSFAAAGDLDGNGSPDVVIATGTEVLVALNTAGHPPLLAQLLTNSSFVVGGPTQVTGTLVLGGPAPARGALVTLSSSNPAAFFPNGSSVTIPAGATSANFLISTRAVTTATAVTITGTYRSIAQHATVTVLPPFSLSSVSVNPASLFGMFGGDPGVGTVTLSGLAADGVTVQLTSSNPAALTVPASVRFTPGSQTATFSVTAQHVSADTPVVVSALYAGVTRLATVTVRKELATVVVTKAEYTASKSQLNVEATSTDRVTTLQVYNATTGAFLGNISLSGVGRFKGQLLATGTLSSIGVQSSLGGLAISPVQQK